MAENKEQVELKDEQLEEVSGGSRSASMYGDLKSYRAYKIKGETDKRALFVYAVIDVGSVKIRYDVMIKNNDTWTAIQKRATKTYSSFLKYVDVSDYVVLP